MRNSDSRDPQRVPVGLGSNGGTLKVDRVVRVGCNVVVAGWCTQPTRFLLEGDRESASFRTERGDVAAHLELTSGDELGFVLVGTADGEVVLCCEQGGQLSRFPLLVEQGVLDDNAAALAARALAWLAGRLEPFCPKWNELITRIPSVPGGPHMEGAIDGAAAGALLHVGAATGWVASEQLSWLRGEDGSIHDLRGAYRMHRDDVSAFASERLPTRVRHRPGFCVQLENVKPGTRLTLHTFDGEVVREISAKTVDFLPANPVEASRLLLKMEGVPSNRVGERLASVEGPLLDTLIQADRQRWEELPIRSRDFGNVPTIPKVSIIIPLYGRSDFVEHQMLEFCRDPWLVNNAEIIYVLDDRSLMERFAGEAAAIHELYAVPFRWVWGGVNRGFAGANNLGAAHAHADYLVFLNSDVFPRSSGWVSPMLQVLENRPDVGVVAPKLLFGGGGIQHAGMDFLRREDLGIWVNHHPLMGLEPSLDSRHGVVEVPAVTGACMALRRKDFDTVAGWDTGYLIGDFEDSDLCMKLAEIGLMSTYLPDVALTHLERQSFRLLGSGEYRTRVVMYNALRHQSRWGDRLAASTKDGGMAA